MDPIWILQDPSGSFRILQDPSGSFRFLQVPRVPSSSFRFLQVPSGSFRFLHILPELLAAFRLKDFQSCFFVKLTNFAKLTRFDEKCDKMTKFQVFNCKDGSFWFQIYLSKLHIYLNFHTALVVDNLCIWSDNWPFSESTI